VEGRVTTVEWDREPVDGGTRVRLRHGGLTDEGVARHAEGWDQFVLELAKASAA
jgi:Activator of Hsp90 ATPase homolog 1-like protein